MSNFLLKLSQAWDALKTKINLVVTVVVTMGITIGALLCVLTLAYFTQIKSLPYPHQDRLFKIEHVIHNNEGKENARAFSYPGMVELYKKQDTFESMAMLSYADDVLTSSDSQPTMKLAYATPDWFSLLEIPMLLGRGFENTEALDSNNPVAVISYNTWVNEFGQDPQVLERKIDFSGVTFRIVGVIDSEFVEPQIYQTGLRTQIWLPWDFNQSVRLKERWTNIDDSLVLVGSLKHSISSKQAEQIITPQVSDTWQEKLAHIDFFKGWRVEMHLTSFKEAILGDISNTINLLLIGVVAIILIALANISNLLMSRTAEQQKSLAIRASLGATRKDLFSTIFAETSLLMSLSVVVALCISQFGFYILKAELSEVLPRVDELRMSLFTILTAIIIVFVLAIFLAMLSTRIIDYRALSSSLQSSGKGTGIQVSKFKRQFLIGIQVTIAMLLVFINLSIFKSSIDTINESSGFAIEDRYTMELSYSASRWPSREERVQIFDKLQQELVALPEVKSVARSSSPFQNFRNWAVTEVVNNTKYTPYRKSVDENYFQDIEQVLIEGRFFSKADVRDNNRVVIINDAFAKELSPNGTALGMKLSPNERTTLEVVGIVKGIKVPGSKEVPSRIYTTSTLASAVMVIRLNPQKELTEKSVVDVLKIVDPMFALYSLESFSASRSKRLFAEYTAAITTSILAIFSFFLASIGLYGILSYGTQMRKTEIGTRMALGASRQRILRLIILDNTMPVLTGITISLASLVVIYIIYSEVLLSYISIYSLALYLATILLVLSISLIACYLPLKKYINNPVSYALRGN